MFPIAWGCLTHTSHAQARELPTGAVQALSIGQAELMGPAKSIKTAELIGKALVDCVFKGRGYWA
jgi:hypothetical protein